MTDELLTLEECAPILRCSYSKVYKIARAGTLPFKQIGNAWLIPRSKLYAALGLAIDDRAAKRKAASSPTKVR